MLYENHKLDLSRKVCHVCGSRLEKNFDHELEMCSNRQCLLYGFKFSIPYIVKQKLLSSRKVIVRRSR